MGTPGDEQIIANCQRGEIIDFRLLVERYQHVIFRLAYHFVGNLEDARDLAQEAFVKAFTSLDSFDLNQRFLPWLRKITTNLCISWLRKQRKYCRMAEANDNILLKIVDPSPSPDVLVERQDLHDTLNNAVRQLPPKYRIVVVLCYFEGLSYKEIAATLDISVAAVEMRLRRARLMLRKQLEDRKYNP